ncbi:hypothetical protein [Candidatus Protochlamydia phocaeensis]|uniref:hypothetical protein n=1 Tax=Candidatus Protochlamydia phocaeensis TaxID=1414722 RepID=UPI000837B449|nr:hypothetical protein [Candidatus Protochlamydia phocaeensis]
MEVDIVGIGATQANFSEYTSPQLLNQYTQAILPLKLVFSQDPNQITSSDYDIILSQINTIRQLAQNGVIDSNGQTQFPTYFNEDMVTKLNDIMRTLAFVNIPPAPGSPPLSDQDKVNTIRMWQNLSQFGVDVSGALNSALTLESSYYSYDAQVQQAGTGQIITVHVSGSPTRTLQSMLQLDYIGSGNSMMAGHMSSLQQALTLSQQALASLTAVQNLSNQLKVTTPQPQFQLPSTDNIDDFKSEYKKAASAYFAQIFPSATPVANAANQLLQVKQDMWQEILDLEQANPSTNRSTPGSLANALYIVVKDISAAFSGISTSNNPQLQSQLFDAVKKWIMDNQNVRIDETGSDNNSLTIQNHLSSALTTAENLEESQRDDVRRYFFIFQQFYKSAATMIQLLGDMFDKMNQGISQQ